MSLSEITVTAAAFKLLSLSDPGLPFPVIIKDITIIFYVSNFGFAIAEDCARDTPDFSL